MAENFWFKFRYKDWLNDTRMLSLEARGLLLEITIYMRSNNIFEMEIDIPLLVRLTGGLTEILTGCLTEFERFATYDFEIRAGKKFLIARGIKKEIAISSINQANGKKGGNPNLKIRLTDSVKRNANRTSNSNSISNSEYNSNSEFNNKGGAGGNSNSSEKKKKLNSDILIHPYDSEKWKETWQEWTIYRSDMGKPIRSTKSAQMQLKWISENSQNEDEAIQIVKDSIRNGYQGLFPLKKQKNNINDVTSKNKSQFDRIMEGSVFRSGS